MAMRRSTDFLTAPAGRGSFVFIIKIRARNMLGCHVNQVPVINVSRVFKIQKVNMLFSRLVFAAYLSTRSNSASILSS